MLKKFLLGALVSVAASASVNAAVINYSILNLSNEGQPITNTYAGTGYVGMYGPAVGQQFNGIFGLEQSDFSRTALEVDISALSGKVINSASLQYTLASGSSQNIVLTAFTANGTLGYFFNAPDNLLSGTAVSLGGANSIDVKDYLNAGLASNSGWFGLNLHGTTAYQWIGANRSGKPDAAQLKLVVDYADVPEPATIALLGLGMLGFAVSRRKSAKSTNA